VGQRALLQKRGVYAIFVFMVRLGFHRVFAMSVTVIFLLGVAPFIGAAAKAPLWTLDKDAVYPSGKFIAEVRDGRSRSDAETAAIAAIALFFKTNADVRTDAVRTFNESIAEQKNSDRAAVEFSQKTYIKENAVISSDVEFLGVHCDAWQNTKDKNQTWYAVAYIDRNEAAGIYDGKIKANMSLIEAIAKDAASESEDFLACALYHQTFPLISLNTEYINMARAVRSDASAYEKEINYMAEIKTKYRKLRSIISFNVSSNENSFGGKIERAMQSILESHDFKVGNQGMYEVKMEIESSEVSMPAGQFVIVGLVLKIMRGDRVILSYSKNYPRAGGTKVVELAYNRAALEVERDLKQNFEAQLKSILG
jgi:hypothetical protein